MGAKVTVWKKEMMMQQLEQWYKNGLGGNDAAAIRGVHPYKNLVEVYLEKVGEAPGKPVSEAMQMGRKLKDFIAQEFMERTGHKAIRRFALFQHATHPYMLAGIDRWIIHEGCGLLCKNTNEFMRDEWLDGHVPERLYIQCQHYMAVTEAKHWWVAALIGGQKFVCVKLERDEAVIRQLIESERDFWERYVLQKVRPAYDGSASAGNLLNRLYPRAENENSLELPHEAERWIEQFNIAEREEKSVLLRKNEAINRLKSYLGKAESGTIGRYTLSWKNVRQRGKDVPGHRRFLIKPLNSRKQVEQKEG